jgi:hypothetical protein
MMRIELGFDRPLNQDAKTRLLLAAGALAKVRKIRFARGDHAAAVYGEALGTQTLLAALAAEGVVPALCTSSLDDDANALADESTEGKKEAVRAIGR